MKYFITSSGTGTGKTLVTSMLCHQLKKQGKVVQALKPIISGFSEGATESDSHILLKSMGLNASPKNVDEISPFRFKAPLSPHIAAEMEGKLIDFEKLLEFCRNKIASADGYLFIEGAGGVMAPITRQQTFLDFIESLKIPVILITGSYLGSISHTLTAYETLKNKVSVHCIIISESEENPMPLQETVKVISGFTGVRTILLPRFNNIDYKWKQSFPILDRIEI